MNLVSASAQKILNTHRLMGDIFEEALQKLGFKRWLVCDSFSKVIPYTKNLRAHVSVAMGVHNLVMDTYYCFDLDKQPQNDYYVHECMVAYEDPELMMKVEWFARHGSIIGYKSA